MSSPSGAPRLVPGKVPSAPSGGHPHPPHASGLGVLTLGALGVVYGDIGTSPLYALRECFHGAHGVAPTRENVLGVLSLIFWSLTLIISIKYLVFVMRADNKGEGGILALLALVAQSPDARRRSRAALMALGLFGAALLYGDGMITPAISVLGAVEGLQVATHIFEPYIVPVTVADPARALPDSVARDRAGRLALRPGHDRLVRHDCRARRLEDRRRPGGPDVLQPGPRRSPSSATTGGTGSSCSAPCSSSSRAARRSTPTWATSASKPIRLAWFVLVLPALLLNYLGQGALLLANPATAVQPFYLMAPRWALYPLVGLATMAAIIASQALISGAFSLTRQAIQLGYCPRLEIEHTSASHQGQIYLPQVNWALMVATIGLVLGFRSSSALAAAYGMAVTSTMVITTMLAYLVARGSWGVSRVVAGSLAGFFLVIELAFFGANLTKVAHGGWFPLVIGAVIYTALSTWKRGRALLGSRLRERMYPFDRFLKDIAERPPTRVSGTAIFMTSNLAGTPATLLHNLQHNKVLHDRIILLTVVTNDVPHVPADERAEVLPLGQGFFRLTLRYGFMEEPDVPAALADAATRGFALDLDDTTFFLGVETLLATRRPGMPLWQERLFVWIARNAVRANTFFKIPPERVVELGMQVEL